MKLETKNNFCSEAELKWLESNVEFLGNGISEANKYTSMNACPYTFPADSSKVKPFLKQDIDMNVTAKEGSLVITLTP